MSLEEMLKQMEDFRSRKEQRDCRPEWLRQFIKQAANLFEPLAHSGRVGFDCQGHERGWTVGMYLGTTEIIGGPDDGKTEHASFVIDIKKINELFQEVERLEWYSVANNDEERFQDATRSVLSVKGTEANGNPVHLELLHSPPQQSAPGLRKSGDDVGLY